MNLSRRELFVLSASLLGAQETERVPWYRKMRRCGQINFNERDHDSQGGRLRGSRRRPEPFVGRVSGGRS